jgi:hypothetical protein
MPYIKKDDRLKLDRNLVFVSPVTVGELNFCVTQLCIDYIKADPISYHRINDVIGALECAKQEFYRRIAVPYETEKIAENGDVY